MIVSRLALDHFRSWGHCVIDFVPGITVLQGPNGIGKTNIVEAIELLSTGMSHRTSTLSQLIQRGTNRAVVRANIRDILPEDDVSDDGDGWKTDDVSSDSASEGPSSHGSSLRRGYAADEAVTVEASLMQRGANRGRLNAGPSRYLRDVTGLFPSVLFSPDDQRLVMGEPLARRVFLDQAGALLSSGYVEVLQGFERIGRQRAALLHHIAEEPAASPADLDMLEIWTGQFIAAGTDLTRRRAEIADRLGRVFQDIHASLTDGEHSVAMIYAPSFAEVTDSSGEPSEPRISEHFRRLFPGEVARGRNLIGPHRDDLIFELDGLPARDFASNGETWTIALAARMALVDVIVRRRGEQPVIILDDVFSQLDEVRRRRIIDYVSGRNQVLITAAAQRDVPRIVGIHVIDVGRLRAAMSEQDAVDVAVPHAQGVVTRDGWKPMESVDSESEGEQG